MTKRLSQLEQERQVRESRLARPYPDDWSEWDTKAALMAAEEFEQKAREALKRRRVDMGLVTELLDAAAEAREKARLAPVKLSHG